jgi:hypothetical protein
MKEFKMTERKSSSIKWRRWHPDALAALRSTRRIQAYSPPSMDGAAEVAARQIMQSAACYHALCASTGPDDSLELSYIQRIEYVMLARISALHRFGYAVRWAIDPGCRELSFAFIARQVKSA